MSRASFPDISKLFTPRNRWDVKLHLLSGITLPAWLRLLRTHWRHIDWIVYLHR